MEQDNQSYFEASKTGSKLVGLNNVRGAKNEVPHPDEEAVHDNDSQQTRFDVQSQFFKEPHPNDEAVHDNDSQQTRFDAQAQNDKETHCDDEAVHGSDSQEKHPAQVHYENKRHPDTEAPYDTERSRDVEVQCENNNGTNEIMKPNPDEEAALEQNMSHYDRGWAWVVLATTFLMEFFVGGLITSSGVIYAALIDEFNKSRAETGKAIHFLL